MAGSGGWVMSMRWTTYASRPCYCLQSFLLPAPHPSTASRASCCLHSFLPSPELQRYCLRSLRPPTEPLTSSRAFDRLQILLPLPELAYHYLQSLLSLSTRPRLQIFLPTCPHTL